MNIYTNETNGFFNSVADLTDKLASNQTTLIEAFLASFLLIGLIICSPLYVIYYMIIKPLMWAYTWISYYLYLIIGSAFYLFFMWLAKTSNKKLQLMMKKTTYNDELDNLLKPCTVEVIEVTPVVEVEKSKIAGLLLPGQSVETGKTFQQFVTENLPVIQTETVDSNPVEVKKMETLEIVDSNPESKQIPSYEFIQFYTIWEYMNTLSNLFKQVKVSELKSYAKDLNIPQYRKLRKLELLIAIAQ